MYYLLSIPVTAAAASVPHSIRSEGASLSPSSSPGGPVGGGARPKTTSPVSPAAASVAASAVTGEVSSSTASAARSLPHITTSTGMYTGIKMGTFTSVSYQIICLS